MVMLAPPLAVTDPVEVLKCPALIVTSPPDANSVGNTNAPTAAPAEFRLARVAAWLPALGVLSWMKVCGSKLAIQYCEDPPSGMPPPVEVGAVSVNVLQNTPAVSWQSAMSIS